MIQSKTTSEHYQWGQGCSGWRLVDTPGLSVIEELMPPNTQEQRHYHQKAQQFFRIISGTATFEVREEIVTVQSGEGLHIPPNTPHCIRNDQKVPLEFLVISQPTPKSDRFDLTR